MSKGKDSLNLCEMPLSVFSPFVPLFPENQDEIIYLTGTHILTKEKIQGYIKVILPSRTKKGFNKISFGKLEEDVIIALLELTYRDRFSSRKVVFNSTRQILDVLGWNTGGSPLNRLIESLFNLNTVTIETDMFWNKEKQIYQRVSFHILDEVGFDHKNPDGSLIKGKKKSGYFIWSEILFDSFKSGFIKNLDTNMYRSIRNPAARKLYRILDKRFYKHKIVWLPLEYFAVNILRLKPLGAWYYKRNFDKYIKELVDRGYLARSWYAWKYNIEYVFFEKNDKQAALFEDTVDIDIYNIESKSLFEALINLGVAEKKARELLITAGNHEFIGRWVDCIARGMAQKTEIERPAGFLVKAIENEWDLPKSYLDYLIHLDNLREKKAKQKIELDQIEECSYCDENGYRVIKYLNMANRWVESRVKCNHLKEQKL